MFYLLLFLTLVSCDVFENATCKIVNGEVVVVPGISKEDGFAWASWSDTINTTGTSHIVIETSNKTDVSSQDKIYCSGYIDGYLMQFRIYNRWLLQKDILNVKREVPFPDSWTTWMKENMDFTRNSINDNKNDSYWKSVGLVMSQFDGLVAGYNARAEKDGKNNQKLSEMDFWILQSIGDIYDLQAIWEPAKERDPFAFMECTALVTILPDLSDVFFGHDTWSDYRKMSNTVKEYIFYVPEWNATRVEVTTKIGALPSSEDFWITSNGLLIFETTLNNLNKTLQQEVKNSKNTLLTWIRNLHASWVAYSGEEWADEFLKLNSGTYNNQYVIVDSKKLVPNKDFDGLIWVTETMPGIAKKGDVTNILLKEGFFPSFNTPFFKEIYEIANYTASAAEKNTSSYYFNPRYLIFKRDAPKVQTLDDFKRLMRYNDYKNDEYGDHDPGLQIFSRYDLRDENPRAFGGLDTKVTTVLTALKNMTFDGIWSPQYENYTFWSFDSDSTHDKFPGLNYDGLPANWTFNWTTYAGQDYDRCIVAKDQKQCFEIESCGWCIYDTACYLGYKDGPLFEECQAGWKVKTIDQPWSTTVIIVVTVASFLFCGVIFGYNIYVYRKKKAEQEKYSQI